MGRDTSARDEQRKARKRQEAFAERLFQNQQRIQQINEERVARQEELTNLSLGFTKDPVTGEFVRVPLTEAQQRSKEIRSLLQERELAALQGDLPVSQATENEIAEQERQLTAQLERIFGPRFRETTGGQQALTKFQSAANERRDRERRGDITSMEGFLTTRTGQELQRTGLEVSGIQGMSSLPLPSGGFLPSVTAPVPPSPGFLEAAAPGIGVGLGTLSGQLLTGGPVGRAVGGAVGGAIGQGLSAIF